jgi:hypothetical protein
MSSMPGARANDVMVTGLRKAMEDLVKAQDHLNAAHDQGRDAVSTALAGITRKLRELQRELSDVIHNAECK